MDAMSLDEQADLLAAVTDRLEVVAPPGWNRMNIQYVAIGDNDWGGSSAVVFSKAERVISIWKPPTDIDALFSALREGMARPGRGTWLKLEYTLHYPDYYSVEYARNIELSEFYSDNLPSAEDCMRELQRFPRNSENIPKWMIETISGRKQQNE